MRVRQNTLRDIAQAAGVSVSTVRYALHGGGAISAQTRARVRQIADEMGYVPNLLARGLRQSRSGQVGVVVPALNRSWYGELVETLDTALYEEGYQLLLSCSQLQHERQSRCLESFVGHQIDGLIALPLHHTEPQSLQRARAAGIPLVLVDRPVPGVEADLVGTDDEEGGYLAASHLLHCGRQRLAYVGPVQKMVEVGYSLSRARGTDRALAEAGLTPAPRLTPPRPQTTQPYPFGYEAVQAALGAGYRDRCPGLRH